MKTILYKSIFLILAIILYTNVLSQENDLIDITRHGDRNKALEIDIHKILGPTTTPKGYGDVLEIKDNALGNKYYFENEHNTVWYKFVIDSDGNLSFDIIPEDMNDDYDFLLFKVDDEYMFCNYLVMLKTNRPVRTNLSRNNKNLKSITGLDNEAKDFYVSSGIGKSYSKSLAVKKGELYYLVVDNVKNDGAGHTIIFNSKEYKTLKGKVVDEQTGKPVKAEVTLENENTGEIISRTESNYKGEYTLKINKELVLENEKYNLSVYSEKYFFKDRIITGKEIFLPQKKTIVAKISRLVKGKSFVVNNINFYGGSSTIIPASKPSMRRLYKLLKRNANLVILIEGHTNGANGADKLGNHQQLSEARTKTIYKYLVENGISKNRLSTKGYGCSRMLYGNGASSAQELANRRVEIKIIEY